MNIIVTGASGYLGRLVADDLKAGAHHVVALPGRADMTRMLLPARYDAIVHAGFEVDFRPAVEAAGESPNMRSARLVCEFAESRQVEHVVFLSAAGALGVSRTPRARNEDDLGTTDPGFESYRATRYIQDKLQAETLLSSLGDRLSVLYLTTVYGPRMPLDTRRQLLRAASFNPFTVVPPGGTSFLDERDFLSAIRRVLATRTPGRFVISSGNTTYACLAQTAASACGAASRKWIVRLPGWTKGPIEAAVMRPSGKLLTGAVVSSTFGYKYYSARKAAAVLGWAPACHLEETLRMALTSVPLPSGKIAGATA